MATPTITSGFTVLSNCDAITGWGGTNTLDTEVLVQGTGALSATMRTAGNNFKFFGVTSQNIANSHIRIWINFASIGFLNTYANGGISIAVTTGGSTATTNIGMWRVGGQDTYQGGWALFTVDTNRAFDTVVGTSPSLSAITGIGFNLNLTGAPRNAVNTWWDFLVMGNGYSVTGGTAGDPITMSTIAAADKSAGYGVVRYQNGVYFVNSSLTIGGTTNTYFSDTSQVVVFEDQPVSSTLYQIASAGSGAATTGMVLTNSVVKSASTTLRPTMAFNATNQNVGTYTGNSFQGLNTVTFKAGQTATGNVFQNCNRIDPSTSTFNNNTISNSVDTTGALLWPPTGSVQSCQFNNNSRGVAITTQGTYTFNGMTFSGNTFDILNTSAGTTTINTTNGSNPSTVSNTGGGSVTIVNAKTFTVTNIIDGSEVRIFRQSDLVELGGCENVSSSPTGVSNLTIAADTDNVGRFKATYSYNYASDTPVFVVVYNVDYLPIRQSATLKATDGSLQVAQNTDRQYARGTTFSPS